MIGDRKFEVQIIDSTEDYVALLQTLFNFDELRSFLARPDFRIVYDCMHGVAGPYVRRIFGELLNVSSD